MNERKNAMTTTKRGKNERYCISLELELVRSIDRTNEHGLMNEDDNDDDDDEDDDGL